MLIRFGRGAHGPSPNALQAAAAARTRAEQQSVARMRQSHKRWCSRPLHGPYGSCSSWPRVKAAAMRRHPCAATLSCPRPPNLCRPVRFDTVAIGQSRRRFGFGLAAILTWDVPSLLTGLAACASRRHPLATADGGAAAFAPAGGTPPARTFEAIRVLSSRPHARIACGCGRPKSSFIASSERAGGVPPAYRERAHGDRPCELSQVKARTTPPTCKL